MVPESGLDLGAQTPSPETHELLMVSAEAREERRAIQLGRLTVHFGITQRGRRRDEALDDGQVTMPMFEALTGEELTALHHAYYGGSRPLFDKMTEGYHVEPNRDSIHNYIGGSVESAQENARKLREADNNEDRRKIKANMQRQSQHIADLLCRETSTNAYTAKLREASLRTTLDLIAAGQPLDEKAALFSADAINDFGHGIAANQPENSKWSRLNLGGKLIEIGIAAAKNPRLLLNNTRVMDMVLHEQKNRYIYWGSRANAALRFTQHGSNRLTEDIREALDEVDREIDRQVVLRQNIANA